MIHARSDYTERIVDTAGLIPDDEPVLLIRGQDNQAYFLAYQWADTNDKQGGDPALSSAVRRHAQRIVDWQLAHGSKIADAPPEVLT